MLCWSQALNPKTLNPKVLCCMCAYHGLLAHLSWMRPIRNHLGGGGGGGMSSGTMQLLLYTDLLCMMHKTLAMLRPDRLSTKQAGILLQASTWRHARCAKLLSAIPGRRGGAQLALPAQAVRCLPAGTSLQLPGGAREHQIAAGRQHEAVCHIQAT